LAERCSRRGRRWRRLVADDITNFVETYHPDRFNLNATVAENLLFGTPIGPSFEFEALAENTYVRQVLDKLDLTNDLVEMGGRVAATMIELFADLPPEHEFFRQFSFVSADDIREYSAIMLVKDGGAATGLTDDQRTKLLSLPLKLIPARHRLDVIDEAMQQRLLEARRVFARICPQARAMRSSSSIRIAITLPPPCRTTSFSARSLMGKRMRSADSGDPRRGARQAVVALRDHGCRARISGRHRRLATVTGAAAAAAIARAVLKRPDLLVLNEATSALDGSAQAKVTDGLRQEMAGRCLIWPCTAPAWRELRSGAGLEQW
jgi:hypothetical protein